MCKEANEVPSLHRADRVIGRAPNLDAPYKGEPLSHQGAPADIYSEVASSVQREARAGLHGTANLGSPPVLGPKCLVAGCNNRMGEGTFHGSLCAPCYQMIVSGEVPLHGNTFISSMKRTLAFATEQRYLDRASALVDARVREWRGAGSELRGAVIGLVVNALKEGEKNAEEGKRKSG